MKVLNKFTLKNLQLNKKRTIVTIIGVMLSTALICAVAGMITSFRQTLINMVISTKGNYHTAFYNVEQDKLQYIENNENIKLYYTTSPVGWAKLEGTKNEDKPYVRIFSYDKNALQNYGVNVIEGRLPENDTEIIIGEHINTNGRVGLRVGDKITLDVGDRVLQDGTSLTDQNPYLTGVMSDTGVLQEESIVNTTKKEYTVVGIMKRPNYEIEGFSAAGYTVLTYKENNTALSDVLVLYNVPGDYEQNNEEIQKAIYETPSKDNVSVNSELLRYQGTMGESLTRTLYLLGGIVIGIIIITSIFVIRNSFSISVAEKNRQYGMMASVGATAKQIKKSVLFEGLLIGIVSIPLGIICGMIAVIVLICIMNNLLQDMLNGIYFVYSIPFIPILLTVALSGITIYLSCLIPARRAAKISPVESIRGNNDVKIKGKKLRTSKLTQKLFGIGGVIASKNLKRSRKKYRTTVISIVVSVVIFISLNSFMMFGQKISSIEYEEIGYNISVSGATEDTCLKIVKQAGVQNYGYYYETNCNINMEKYGTAVGKEINNNKAEAGLALIVYNDDCYKAYLKELGISEKEYANGGILIDEFKYRDSENNQSLEKIYGIKDNEAFEISVNEKTMNITNLKRTDKRPIGKEGYYYTTGFMVVSESFIQNLNNKGLDISTHNDNITLSLKAEDSNELENTLNDLKKENEEYKTISVVNIDTVAKNQNRMFLLIEIFLYGFITVITLIGVTNIFNTVSTNMILRSKEFAMLKSIGMTNKEFNRMIRLESLLYGLKSLIIGIPIGIAGSYAIYLAYASQIDLGYSLPLTAIILSIVFVFVIVGATMKYSLNKINKQNIIETIRKDNI